MEDTRSNQTGELFVPKEVSYPHFAFLAAQIDLCAQRICHQVGAPHRPEHISMAAHMLIEQIYAASRARMDAYFKKFDIVRGNES